MGDATRLGAGREFDAIRAMVERWGTLASGVGDDAAMLELPAGERLIVSTDSSVENVHFRRQWLEPREIAYRAAASALSDLAAMAATPLGLLVAMTLPAAWRGALTALADGIGEAATMAGASIVGGDLSAGAELSLTVTVLGHAASPLRRSGARAGDRVYVTGALGAPLAALEALERGVQPGAEHRARFAHPVPRIREAQWLAARGARAAVDISDGLAADAGHLAAASGAAIVLDLERVPTVRGVSTLDAARSGEEYELIVCAPTELDVRAFREAFDLSLTEVGAVEPGAPRVEARVGGKRVDLPGGYDHLSR